MKTFLLLLSALVLLGPGAVRAAQVSLSYNYDAAGRLNAVNYDGASRTAYGYDKNGSLLSRVSSVTPASSPPAHLAAVYNGLVTHLTPDMGNTGAITLKMLGTGAFSGKITLAGGSYSFKGSFNADGSSIDNIIIPRKLPLGALTLSLALDVSSGVATVTGTLSDGGFTSDVALAPALFNAKTHLLPAGIVGKYTTLFSPTDGDPAIPQADGYALVTIKNTGGVSLAGKLADNSSVTHSSLIVGDGSWPVFVPLLQKAGFIAGEVMLVANPGVSDFEGDVSWLKPATTGNFHPDGYNTVLEFYGARYLPPAAGQRALILADASPNAELTATGGNLSGPLIKNVTWDAKNKFSIPQDASFTKLSLAPATGLFTSSFTDGAGTLKGAGVILQSLNFGSGFFPGSTVSGSVLIESKP